MVTSTRLMPPMTELMMGVSRFFTAAFFCKAILKTELEGALHGDP